LPELRILLSTLTASSAEAHGGPVVSSRQAAALARRGNQVLVAAPAGAGDRDGAVRVEIYPGAGPSRLFPSQRGDPERIARLGEIIRRFRPHVLYDVHGPAWAVEAAKAGGIPVVSMVGDYAWYCLQTFLVDSRLRRCGGPDSPRKCFGCLDRNYPLRWRAIHAVLGPAARAGIVGLALWDGVAEALDYLPRVRAMVDRFVVGDAQARHFLAANGIAAERLVDIPQGLPEAALVPRPRAPGAPVRDRPLRLAFVGRPHADKGIHVLAAAFDSLPRDLPVQLALVHSRLATPANLRPRFPSGPRFDADVASGRIRLVQPASQHEVFEEMARADVGVVPSIAYESPSLAMLEFVAQGTPVIRSESRGMDHVITDGVNGRTFPYGDAPALAAILRDLAADPSPLEAWRAALPPVASDDQYAARLAQVFDSLRFQHV
jgi:glycosyltransferase involved in cell wall biosynthesis